MSSFQQTMVMAFGVVLRISSITFLTPANDAGST